MGKKTPPTGFVGHEGDFCALDYISDEVRKLTDVILFKLLMKRVAKTEGFDPSTQPGVLCWEMLPFRSHDKKKSLFIRLFFCKWSCRDQNCLRSRFNEIDLSTSANSVGLSGK